MQRDLGSRGEGRQGNDVPVFVVDGGRGGAVLGHLQVLKPQHIRHRAAHKQQHQPDHGGHQPEPAPGQGKGLRARRAVSVFKLLRHVLITHDGSRDKLRKHRDVSREVDDVFLHLCVVAVNVYRIGHRLERVEGNADRQREPERGDAYAGNAAERRGEQIEVFEENEQREVDNGIDRQNGPRFFIVGQPIAGDEESGSIVQRDGEYHQQDVHRLAPAVKHEIYDKKPEIPIARRHDIIYRQYDRQINKQEKNA